jgi:hypothetical protein
MSQADLVARLEYLVAELEAMLARVTRERDILLRRYENPNAAAQQHIPQHQPQALHHHDQGQNSRDKAPSGIRLLNARPVPASGFNGRVALPHNHHDPTASVHVQSNANEEKSLNDLVGEGCRTHFFYLIVFLIGQ